jgi:hypothetical protein
MRRFSLSILLLAALGVPAPALAQTALPSAAPDGDAPNAEKPKRAPAGAKIDSVVGKTLKLDGRSGALVLNRTGDGFVVDRLLLVGESTADSGAPCTIEVRGEAPLSVNPVGKVDGLAHYVVDFPACPLEFSLVDKGVIVPQQSTACVFQAAACQASPSGLWGPDAASLQASAKQIAVDRRRADATLSSDLKTLLKQNKGADAAAVSSDEEAFASQREDLCRGYDGEAQLGFCSSRLTEARAAALAARIGEKKKPAKP